MRIILFAALALAACGTSDNDPGPGGVTQGEARQLDQAAADTDINATVVEDADAANAGDPAP